MALLMVVRSHPTQLMTLREQITKHCRNKPEWIASGELQRLELKDRNGKTVSPQTIGRMLRYMEVRKLLAVKYIGDKQHAHYKHLPEYLRKYYIPSSQRWMGDALFSIPQVQVHEMVAKYTRALQKQDI